ncbi:hypothetical protein OROHE_006065 [Orobanche hederae]
MDRHPIVPICRFSAALRDILCPLASSLRIKCIVKEANQPLRQATHGTLRACLVTAK